MVVKDWKDRAASQMFNESVSVKSERQRVTKLRKISSGPKQKELQFWFPPILEAAMGSGSGSVMLHTGP